MLELATIQYLESHASPLNIRDAQSSLGIDWQRKNYHRHGDRFSQDENLMVDRFGSWSNSCYVLEQPILLPTNQKPLFTR